MHIAKIPPLNGKYYQSTGPSVAMVLFQNRWPIDQDSTCSLLISTESKLKELDDLANKGYITPEEYKTRCKAIIDGI